MLNKELDLLKEALTLTESAMTRDHVIEKLKDVSIETRELIENCDRANKEKELFENKTKELKDLNDSLLAENRNLQSELETRNVEMESLRRKLEMFNTQSAPSQEKYFWLDDISIANIELQNIEEQIKTIIVNLQNCEAKKRNLEMEIGLVRSQNESLRELSTKKDELIAKQKSDFLEMKATLDEYGSEILRLKEKLAAVDVAEFMHFKRSLMRFGSFENIESLLSKLLVLQEIEEFFDKNLSPHVEPRNNHESDLNGSIVTDKKQDTINKIKNYLEKALSAIEKLNDKMIRLRNEYESKLHAKSSEISTLREVLSNAILYNKILEQTLQQYKDNVQLDKTIGNETDELLIVNETLLDGFDTLKQLYRVSEQSNSFLYAKSEQLKFFTKLIELYVRRSLEESEQPKVATYKTKIAELFLLMRDIFNEISMNEPNARKLIECQQVIEKCEKSLITKDYLKNTVENMSQEVKRLTSKVEYEMAEKIREIEALKGEVDNVKTDNRELVNKIKNCNREIVSLSTENYELNEKLESLVQIKNRCENLEQELERVKERMSDDGFSRPPSECTSLQMKNLKEICSSLKIENTHLRRAVEMYIADSHGVLSEARNLLCTCFAESANRSENFVQPQRNCCDISNDGVNPQEKASETSARELEAGLISLRDTCSVLKKENEDLKAGITTFMKLTSNDVIPGLHSTFTQLLKNIDSSAKHKDDYKNSISITVENIASTSQEVKHLNQSVRSSYEEMAHGFSKQLQTVIYEIQVRLRKMR
jgi:hypothetical protein